jgi:GDP-D-mannose 3',5'-epimerase
MAEEVKYRILVTGGGGFIGSHTAKRLKEQGHFVRIADWKKNEFWADNEICRMVLHYFALYSLN